MLNDYEKEALADVLDSPGGVILGKIAQTELRKAKYAVQQSALHGNHSAATANAGAVEGIARLFTILYSHSEVEKPLWLEEKLY